MITREEWEPVKAAGMKKWDEGRKCTEEKWMEWWDYMGKATCSFCRNWFEHSQGCPCPLNDRQSNGELCSKEYYACYKAFDADNFPAFHVAAEALYQRIAKIEYEDLPEIKEAAK